MGVQFDEVVARLANLPAHLPGAPRELTPVFLAGPDGNLPDPLRRWSQGPQRQAAVLLLLHPDSRGEAQIVLTERQEGGHRHAGQVSFPGGALEDSDESAVHGALREAREEIGLDAQSAGVKIAGVLAPVDVRVSSFLVHPVVATAPHRPTLVADEREVAAILHAPMDAFLPGAQIEMVTAERDGYRLRYGAYDVAGHLIWGATATMLGRLGALLAEER